MPDEESRADDGSDEEPAGLPPHPLDRVWFHPSELFAQPPSPSGTETPQGGRRSRDWGLAAAAVVVGAVATLAVLAATGTLGSDGRGQTPGAVATAVSGLANNSISAVVTASGGSVVAVRVIGTDTTAAPVTVSGVALARSEVLTSASALVGAVAITVATEGRVLTAEVAGVDPDTDLALLRVAGGELTAARLGSSDELEVGETVVGVGVAGGDHRWAGQGIVSALGRLVTIGNGTLMPGLVETDLRPGAAVSGGALLDSTGAVVGVLTGAAPGHAVPIEWARDLAEQLATSGRAYHGWLGVDAVDAGDHPGGGARVTGVATFTPAQAAGLAPGDVITAIGGQRVTDFADLVAALAQRRPGDPVVMMVWRSGQRLRMEASLGERGATAPLATFTSSR
jgi:S1-C subfamily serine protease